MAAPRYIMQAVARAQAALAAADNLASACDNLSHVAMEASPELAGAVKRYSRAARHVNLDPVLADYAARARNNTKRG